MTLPETLDIYFSAQNTHDIDRLVACFAPEAKVRDEGEDIVGRDAIRAWKQKVRDKYRFTTEPLRHWREDGSDLVRARVTGTFPGSPVELTYKFMLKDGMIARLEVV